jgi:hypothetical protein
VAGEYLATKPRENWRHIVNIFGDWWGWTKDPAGFQRADFNSFRKYGATLGLRPRTEHNYLIQVCTFFRATGRVVIVADSERDATLKRAMAVVPNSLILVSSDFPTVNRGMPDYYCDDQIEGLFGNVINLWERVMLACSGLLTRLLQKLAEDLRDRGKLDLSESFIDASFSGAKKGALVSAPQNAAKAAKSWPSQTAMVFLSPCTWPALRLMKQNSSNPHSTSDSLPKLRNA